VHRLLWIATLVSIPLRAQNVEDATELLRTVRSFAESIKSWRAEVVQTSQMSGPGLDPRLNLQDEVRTKIAAQPPLKMIRQNSGSDRTVMVCDGAESFYSGDGHSYYKYEVRVTPKCDLPLSGFYNEFYNMNNISAPISAVGRDHVRLADGDRDCIVVRAASKQGTVNAVQTMCIDPTRPMIVRYVKEVEDESTGFRSLYTITFSDFEINPAFPPDTFRFSIPPGAVEAKAP
jgi:outer membrane lipoprotein-sorting protein